MKNRYDQDLSVRVFDETKSFDLKIVDFAALLESLLLEGLLPPLEIIFNDVVHTVIPINSGLFGFKNASNLGASIFSNLTARARAASQSATANSDTKIVPTTSVTAATQTNLTTVSLSLFGYRSFQNYNPLARN